MFKPIVRETDDFDRVVRHIRAVPCHYAELTINSANVLLDAGATEEVVSGEAVTAGQTIYKKATDSKWYKAQCDGTAEEAGSGGIRVALTTAPGANQPLVSFKGGTWFPGANTNLAIGSLYVLGNTAGAIMLFTDLATNSRITLLGLATTVTKIQTLSSLGQSMYASGLQVP